MKDNFLKEGDVITLKKGMTVYAEIAGMFIYFNSLSEELRSTDVIIGTTYTNKKNLSSSDKFIKDIVKDVVRKCESNGFIIDPEKVSDFIEQNTYKPDLKTFVLEGGEFVVIKTRLEGGGTAHGQYDVYPDGYRVYCKKLKDGKFDENGIEVNFYQSGSFSAMIKNVTPIRKMKMSYE